MTLSANLVADSLQQFGGTMMLAQEREFFFSKVQMLSLSHADELRDDVLYISDARTLRKMSKKNFKNHFFVFSAKVSCLNTFANTTKSSKSVKTVMHFHSRISSHSLKTSV